MLLHRKNDSRDASARLLMRYGVFGATCGGWTSCRNQNSRLVSSASSPSRRRRRIPHRPPAPACRSRAALHVGIGHRPPVRAPRERARIFLAHAVSLPRPPAGRRRSPAGWAYRWRRSAGTAADRDLTHVRDRDGHRTIHGVLEQRLLERLPIQPLDGLNLGQAQERHAHAVRAGLDGRLTLRRSVLVVSRLPSAP